jgi:hypothetical protein
MKTAERLLEEEFPLAIIDDDEWTGGVLKIMEEYASQYKSIIQKQEELIEALNNQVALVCSDAWMDTEGYGYKALASSQKITSIESELEKLKELNK